MSESCDGGKKTHESQTLGKTHKGLTAQLYIFVLNLHFGEFEVFCNSSDFVSLLYWCVCATDFATVTLFMF